MWAFSSTCEQYNNSSEQSLPLNHSHSKFYTSKSYKCINMYMHTIQHLHILYAYAIQITHNSQSCNRLVHPSIFLEQMANNYAGTEKRDEKVHRNNRTMIMSPQHSQNQVHLLFHLTSTSNTVKSLKNFYSLYNTHETKLI